MLLAPAFAWASLFNMLRLCFRTCLSSQNKCPRRVISSDFSRFCVIEPPFTVLVMLAINVSKRCGTLEPAPCLVLVASQFRKSIQSSLRRCRTLPAISEMQNAAISMGHYPFAYLVILQCPHVRKSMVRPPEQADANRQHIKRT